MKVCDKAAVFSHHFLSALLQKELRPFQIVTLDLAIFVRKRNRVSETASNALGSSKSVRKDVYCLATG